jgi:hypothetical protein
MACFLRLSFPKERPDWPEARPSRIIDQPEAARPGKIRAAVPDG